MLQSAAARGIGTSSDASREVLRRFHPPLNRTHILYHISSLRVCPGISPTSNWRPAPGPLASWREAVSRSRPSARSSADSSDSSRRCESIAAERAKKTHLAEGEGGFEGVGGPLRESAGAGSPRLPRNAREARRRHPGDEASRDGPRANATGGRGGRAGAGRRRPEKRRTRPEMPCAACFAAVSGAEPARARRVAQDCDPTAYMHTPSGRKDARIGRPHGRAPLRRNKPHADKARIADKTRTYRIRFVLHFRGYELGIFQVCAPSALGTWLAKSSESLALFHCPTRYIIMTARARYILASTLPSGSVSLLFCSRQGFTGLTGLLPLLRVLESRSRHCTLQASRTPHSESKEESPARPHAAFHERQCRRGG